MKILVFDDPSFTTSGDEDIVHVPFLELQDAVIQHFGVTLLRELRDYALDQSVVEFERSELGTFFVEQAVKLTGTAWNLEGVNAVYLRYADVQISPFFWILSTYMLEYKFELKDLG